MVILCTLLDLTLVDGTGGYEKLAIQKPNIVILNIHPILVRKNIVNTIISRKVNKLT